MADLKAILTNARLLVEQGWTKGKFRRVVDGVECYCALGAICMASTDSVAYDSALAHFASANSIGNRDCIPRWNDSTSRTREQVLAAFDKAIAATE